MWNFEFKKFICVHGFQINVIQTRYKVKVSLNLSNLSLTNQAPSKIDTSRCIIRSLCVASSINTRLLFIPPLLAQSKHTTLYVDAIRPTLRPSVTLTTYYKYYKFSATNLLKTTCLFWKRYANSDVYSGNLLNNKSESTLTLHNIYNAICII